MRKVFIGFFLKNNMKKKENLNHYYQKWWFWFFVTFIILSVIGLAWGDDTSQEEIDYYKKALLEMCELYNTEVKLVNVIIDGGLLDVDGVPAIEYQEELFCSDYILG